MNVLLWLVHCTVAIKPVGFEAAFRQCIRLRERDSRASAAHAGHDKTVDICQILLRSLPFLGQSIQEKSYSVFSRDARGSRIGGEKSLPKVPFWPFYKGCC